MNIDVHNHAIPQRVLDLMTRESVYGVTFKDNLWHGPNIFAFALVDAWYSPDAKLRELDSKELDAAVLSVAPKPLYFYELPVEPQALVARETNIGLAEFCSAHPDRLRWMAHVPLAWPEESATILEEATLLGASGVQVGPSANGKRLDQAEYEPFWAAVDRLHVPVFLHPGYEQKDRGFEDYGLGNILGLPVETTIALERMISARLFDRYPRLRMVVAHGGGFFPYNVGRMKRYIEVMESLHSLPKDPWSYVGEQIMFDSLVYDIETLRFLVDKAGSENIMIGTDCAFSSAPLEPMAELRAAIADPAALRRAAEGNAARLFGFPESAQ